MFYHWRPPKAHVFEVLTSSNCIVADAETCEMFNIFSGRRSPLGIPGHQWDVNIKMILKELVVRSWTGQV